MAKVGEEFDEVVLDGGQRYTPEDTVRVLWAPDRGTRLVLDLEHGNHTVLEFVPHPDTKGFARARLRRFR
jgi:hypothetical protein